MSAIVHFIKKLPLLAVVCVGLLGYLEQSWHQDEQSGYSQLLQDYQSSGLFEFEKQHYLDYHLRSVRLDFGRQDTDYSDLVSTLGEHGFETQPEQVLHDYNFVSYLKNKGLQFIDNQRRAQWLLDRQQLLSDKITTLPSYRFGMLPTDPTLDIVPQPPLYQMLSAAWFEPDLIQFYFGLGLLFLSLAIFELYLGRASALLLVLSGSLLTSQLTLFFSPNPGVQLVGLTTNALILFSGALALIAHTRFIKYHRPLVKVSLWSVLGLLWGAAVGAWYFLLSATTHALIVVVFGTLIFCLATLAVRYVFSEGIRQRTQGGKSSHRDRQDAPHSSDHSGGHDDEEYRQALTQAFSALEAFDFEQAKRLFSKLCERFPKDRISAQQRYYLAAAQRDKAMYRHINHYADTLVQQQDFSRATILLRQLNQFAQSDQSPAKVESSYTKLMNLFLSGGKLKPAEQCFHLLYQSSADHNLVNEAGFLLHSAFQKQGLQHKAKEFVRYSHMDDTLSLI